MKSIAILIGGIAIGILLSVWFMKKCVMGCLRVDQSDPNENPYLFLELTKELGHICRKKYVILKVKLQDFITHK